MSDHAESTATAVQDSPATGPLFADTELKEFDRDDIEAGSNICKMLSVFFFYTLIVMGMSTLITYKWVLSSAGSEEAPPQTEVHAPPH